MKKMDVLLIAVVLAAAAGLYFSGWLRPSRQGAEAVLLIDGQEYARYPLDTNHTFTVEVDNRKNVVTIKDGYADVVDASCPDKLCVNQRPVHLQGETIVCLPNKFVVEIQGGEENAVDVVTG